MRKTTIILLCLLFLAGTVWAASEIRVKYRDEVAVLAMSTTTAANAPSTASSWIDNIDGASYLGAQAFDVYIGVNTGPSGGSATVAIYMVTSLNENAEESGNTNYCMSVEVENGEVGEFYAGRLWGTPGYFKLFYIPEDYGITGGVTVVPILDEAQ